MSPGSGAYRIQLSQISGKESAEAVLAGESDVTLVDLPSGEYWGRMQEVGQAAGREHRFRLELRPDEPMVRLSSTTTGTGGLSSRPRTLDLAIRSTRLPRSSQLTRSGSGERRERSSDTNPALPPPVAEFIGLPLSTSRLLQGPRSTAGDLFPSFYTDVGYEQRLRDALSGIYLPRRREPAPFAIALSEDRSPWQNGSWARPTLVRAELEPMDDGVRFRVEQRQERLPEGGYRVRMTVGIAGVPAIRIPVPMYAEGTIIEVRPIHIDDQLDFAIEIKAVNERVQALVAALTELSDEEALKILRWNAESQVDDAIMILAEKRRDLWAATAAALLLAKTRRLEEVAQWPLNLSQLALHIPDAAIAAAWACAAHGAGGQAQTEQSTMRYLSCGLSVGAPTFSAANSLALEMLNTLQNTARNREVRSLAREAYLRVARRSWSKISRGPYMLWEQSGAQLQSGRLLGPRYLELLWGIISR